SALSDQLSAIGSKIKRRHFAKVPHEQPSARNGGMVPGLPRNRREPRKLLMSVGRGPDKRDVAVFSEHNQMITSKEDLAVPVPAGLPFQLARRRLETGENRLIKPVDVSLMQDRARELVLHPRVLPDRTGDERLSRSGDLEGRRAVAVPGREKHPVVSENERPRHADAVI